MSIVMQALTLLPAVAAIIVVVAALADRRESSSLNDLRALDVARSSPVEDLERSAA